MVKMNWNRAKTFMRKWDAAENIPTVIVTALPVMFGFYVMYLKFMKLPEAAPALIKTPDGKEHSVVIPQTAENPDAGEAFLRKM